MAADITITADHDGTLANSDIRAALTGMDVSATSPVDADGRSVGTSHTDDTVTLVVDTPDGGEFTKTSQTALTDALASVEAVDADSITVEGGYQPDDTGDDSGSDTDGDGGE